jgi:hypothetical protein
LGIAFPVSDYSELQNILNNLLTDAQKRESISNECTVFTDQNIGATLKILNKVFNNS